MHIFKNADYNFLRWRWHAVALSWVVILAGLVDLHEGHSAQHRIRRRDVASVTQFDQPVSIEQVRTALDRSFKESVIQSYGNPSQHQVLIRVPQSGAESGDALSSDTSRGHVRTATGQSR
jgi:preprotein translocase subunit SecF